MNAAGRADAALPAGAGALFGALLALLPVVAVAYRWGDGVVPLAVYSLVVLWLAFALLTPLATLALVGWLVFRLVRRRGLA